MKITDLRVRDIRFPTSRNMDGSDALNLGDYSATYVTLTTESGLTGDGLTFTNGRGNEICVAAVHALEHHVIGHKLDDIIGDLRGFLRRLTVDKQLRWLLRWLICLGRRMAMGMSSRGWKIRMSSPAPGHRANGPVAPRLTMPWCGSM